MNRPPIHVKAEEFYSYFVAKVMLDGVEVKDAVEVNEEEGWMECLTDDPPSDPDYSDWPTVRREGKVRLLWKPQTVLYL